VDQTIGTARDTAAFARRVVLRALTIVGGAAAGTAIAWCVSTASASADPVDATTAAGPESPVVRTAVSPAAGELGAYVHGALDNAVTPTATAAKAATALAGELTDQLPDPPSAQEIQNLGERVRQTAGGFGDDAAGQLPSCAEPLCGLEHLGRSATAAAGDGAGLGRSDNPSPAPAAVPPAAAGKVATAGIDPDHMAERTATGRAYSDGMPRRGSPAPGMPSSPDFPNWPAPLAPAMPVPGHSGSTGNPADSALFAALPWQDRTPALLRGLTVPATEASTVVRVGAQPGVAPD
jgi:hypothetical protein